MNKQSFLRKHTRSSNHSTENIHEQATLPYKTYKIKQPFHRKQTWTSNHSTENKHEQATIPQKTNMNKQQFHRKQTWTSNHSAENKHNQATIPQKSMNNQSSHTKNMWTSTDSLENKDQIHHIIIELGITSFCVNFIKSQPDQNQLTWNRCRWFYIHSATSSYSFTRSWKRSSLENHIESIAQKQINETVCFPRSELLHSCRATKEAITSNDNKIQQSCQANHLTKMYILD